MLTTAFRVFGLTIILMTTVCQGEESCLQMVQKILERNKDELDTGCTKTRPEPSPLSQCQENWLEFEDSCYFFSEQSVNFASAADECKIKGAHLVHVQSEEENAFIKDYLRGLGNNPVRFWMGLTDTNTEGEYRFHGTDLPASFFDWASGEPNNVGGEDCVNFPSDKDFAWNDSECRQALKFVCEKEIN